MAFTDSRVDGLPAELCLIQSTSGSHSPSGTTRHPYVAAPDRCMDYRSSEHTDFVTPDNGGAAEDATTFRLRPMFVW